ncbi:nitrate reductase molybdenum cofactor assembly chaperone, partial [Burkholderiaceae bacterium DAT-1]|nr:nitrate reductase molybdenum cofactor assembly chaperone [Burkholderiaceae bacterium DAT-1]
MSHFRVLSALMSYPDQDLLDALPAIESWQREHGAELDLAPLFAHMHLHDLIGLQEYYVATFDRTPSHSLHLFEHVHGESRDRGSAMVDLMEEYRKFGFEPVEPELPDFLPLFLECLGHIPPEAAQPLLDDAIHVIHAIGERLQRS